MCLSRYETFVTLCFEDGDLDDLGHDDQFSKTLEMAEHHCEVDVLEKHELLKVFDKVRTQIGASTPPGGKHQRSYGSSDSDFDSDSEISDLDISDQSDNGEVSPSGHEPALDVQSSGGIATGPTGPDTTDVVSDSDESDDQVVFSGVKATYSVNRTDGRLVYRPETLVSMIPRDAEYDRLRESIGILRISNRFLPGMSNRRARAILFKKGHDLKAWPRFEYREVLPYPLREKGVPFGGKPVRVLGLIRNNIVVREVATGEPFSARRFIKRQFRKVEKLSYEPRTGIYRRIAVVGKDTINVVGGMTYPRKRWITDRIDPGYKKYWYFLRKNGRVYRSAHHPYDDE